MDLLRTAQYNSMVVNKPFVSNYIKNCILEASKNGEYNIVVPKDNITTPELMGLKKKCFKITYHEGKFPDECYYIINWKVSFFEKVLLKLGLQK